MNKDKEFKADLTNCDKEPIHLVGKIQPHGAILVADRETGRIEQVSRNAHDFLEQKSDLLGASIYTILNTDAQIKKPVVVNSTIFIPHVSENKIVVEVEKLDEERSQSCIDDLQFLGTYWKEVTAQSTMEGAADVLAEKVQEYLDYDRVMIYRFDEEWNGGVVGEKVKLGIASYYNHHFPASDIPAQAREMLLQKVTRQIPDVNCTSVDLLSLDGYERETPIDLLRSELRYPSEIHLEFLRNMHVKATFTVSIIVKKKLWGIIACQNETELNIDYSRRNVCELMSRYFASHLEGLKETIDKTELDRYTFNRNELLQSIQYHQDIQFAFNTSAENLLKCTSASGVAVFYDGKLSVAGEVPGKQEISDLLSWLFDAGITESFHTNNLSRFYSGADAITSAASGILAVAIYPGAKEYIIWFKPEITLTRVWAGDPNKQVMMDSGRIHPRKSFDNWKEQVKGKSLPWTLAETIIANEMSQQLINMKITQQNDKLLQSIDDLTRAQMQLKESNKNLQAANKDLEGFSYTVSHDLRSPLTSILGSTQLLLAGIAGKLDPEAIKFVEIINNQAKKMNDLVQEVLNYAKAGLVWSRKDEVDMNEVVETLRRDMALPENIRLDVDLLPKVKYNKVQLTQVLQNLVDNARKYNAKAEGIISITARERPKDWEITVADNGIGIEEKNYHKVFEVFGTAHGEDRKDSIGIGLAIVKKIIETNQGRISFTSKIGEGTSFTFTIPK